MSIKTVENTPLTGAGFLLLRGGEVYAPQALGQQDILIFGERIALIDQNIDVSHLPECRIFDARGLFVCPGLIDQHIHLIGGGGEAGPHTRTPEAKLSKLAEAGITTAVGLLGTDAITRHPESLLAKTRALNNEGLTAYMLTGAYAVPTPTITGSIQRDIAFIDPIIGVKTAISDHRSSAPTIAQLAHLAAEARVGGLLGGKAGISVFHMGNSPKFLDPLYGVLDNSDVPISKLLPTHVNRHTGLFEAAIRYAKDGGYIDLTSGINPDLGARNAVKPSRAILQALDAGVALEHLTISSDGNGSQPLFNTHGRLTGITVAGFESLLHELRDLVKHEGLPLQEALCPFTHNVATLLQLDKSKGRLCQGNDADILLLDEHLQLRASFARGQQITDQGKAIVRGTFDD